MATFYSRCLFIVTNQLIVTDCDYLRYTILDVCKSIRLHLSPWQNLISENSHIEVLDLLKRSSHWNSSELHFAKVTHKVELIKEKLQRNWFLRAGKSLWPTGEVLFATSALLGVTTPKVNHRYKSRANHCWSRADILLEPRRSAAGK